MKGCILFDGVYRADGERAKWQCLAGLTIDFIACPQGLYMTESIKRHLDQIFSMRRACCFSHKQPKRKEMKNGVGNNFAGPFKTMTWRNAVKFIVLLFFIILPLEPTLLASSPDVENSPKGEQKETTVQGIEDEEDAESPEICFPDELNSEKPSPQEIRQIVYYFARTGDKRAAEALFAGFMDLCGKFPDSKILNRCLAYTAAYLAEKYVDDKQLEEIQEYHRVLEILSEHFRNDEEINLKWAQGNLFLIYCYENAGQVAEAAESLEGIRKLAERFPDSREMRLASVKGMLSLEYNCEKTGNIEKAEKYYQELEKETARFPDDPDFNSILAQGMLNQLILRSGKMQSPEQQEHAEAIYHKLKRLAERFHEDEEINLDFLQGTCQLLNAFAEKGQYPKAETIYQQLAPISIKFRNNREIRLALAKCALSLEWAHVQASGIELADKYFQDLKKEASQFPDDPDFNSTHAQGMVNEIILRRQMQLPDEAEEIYRTLEPLAEKFPDNEDINGKKLYGAFNLIVAFQNAKQYDKAEKLFREQKTLLSKFPDSLKINLAFAQSAESFFPVFSEKNEEKMTDFLPELRMIAKRFPDQPEIAGILARGLLYDMNNGFKNKKRVAVAKEEFQELDALSKEFPAHPGINFNHCLGLAYRVLADSRERQEDNAKKYFQELKAAAMRFPDDPKINLILARTAYIMKLNYDEKKFPRKNQRAAKRDAWNRCPFSGKSGFSEVAQRNGTKSFP